MGSVYTRGTRAKPRYYIKLKVGRIHRMLAAKGARSKGEAKIALAEAETRVRRGETPFPKEPTTTTGMAAALEQWSASLTNRNAYNDRTRIQDRIHGHLGHLEISAVTLPAVMRWQDDLTREKMSGESRRQALNLLSRFFGWAIARGLTTVNPVRMIPNGSRPKGAGKTDGPWLQDDSLVPKLVAALGPAVGAMFYLGNRSGLRTGEICGLRISDLGFLAEGLVRVRYSYGGPLKEDRGTGKLKFVPASTDAAELPYLKQRLAEATGEELVFPYVPPKRQNRRRTSTWTGYRKEHLEACWEAASRDLGVKVTWYQATRRTFVSRHLRAGASLDEVSAAVGHSHPQVTKRYYDHFVRRSFSDQLRRGITEPVPKPETATADPSSRKARTRGRRTSAKPKA